MASLIHRVASVMGEIAPLSLADRSWDNVGILVESPESNGSGVVMLTVDLTPAVMDECLRQRAEVIVAYHPPIFSALKRLTLSDARQRVVLQAIRHGVSIYSPHTSLDAAQGGINDWLASVVDPSGSGARRPVVPLADYANTGSNNSNNNNNSHSNSNSGAIGSGGLRDCDAAALGMGRVVRLREPRPLGALVDCVRAGLCAGPSWGPRVALPDGWGPEAEVGAVAVCAGSGAGVFRKMRERVDVLLTGEMGHHDVLDANAKGQAVVLCEHTNTERGFLASVLQPELQRKLGEGVQVIVSVKDKDPLVIW